jgi:hypothetical protein
MTEPKMTLDEAKAVVATKTAPKVTEDSIKGKINIVNYMLLGTTTICIITMQNGFRFIGTSTPASHQNFDADVGARYAYDNAFKQIWSHEGYLLKERLSRQDKHDE